MDCSEGRFRRRAILPTVAAACALASPPALAGHYTAAVYGGSGAIAMNNPYSPFPYGPTQYGWGAGGGYAPWTICSGNVTATFTWVSDGEGDDPPDNVIITETCSASASGYGYGAPALSCDNDLGSP